MAFNKTLEDFKEELLETLESMKERSFIVEGKKDGEALGLFGFIHVHVLNGKGLYEFCEGLNREVEYVILTDFDPEGEVLAKKLERHMQGLGIHADNVARSKLRRLFIRSNLNTIQGLRNLV